MRTRARNRQERCVQILRWLIEEFDLPKDMRFHWMETIDWKEGEGERTLGQVEEDTEGGRLTLMVSASGCRTRSLAIDTVIHEAAHAKLWEKGLGFKHGDAFWRVAGRMYDAYEHHGHIDSKSYFVE